MSKSRPIAALHKAIIESTLNLLPMVTWDRYTVSEPPHDEYSFYGWIARDDEYKDFIVLNFEFYRSVHEMSFTTSSAKYSKEIAKILDMPASNHTECKRIGRDFDVVNVVEL